MKYIDEKIILVPFTREYATEEYRSWFHDEDITKYNSHGLGPMTDDQVEDFLKNINNNKLVWAILDKEQNKHIGNVSLQGINYISRSAEFAIVIGDKGFWDKGVGYESAKLVFNHGFKRLGLNRIWTGTAFVNNGMKKLAIKLGMQQEGIFRSAAFLNGKYVDVVEYGVLKHEWFNNQCATPTKSSEFKELKPYLSSLDRTMKDCAKSFSEVTKSTKGIEGLNSLSSNTETERPIDSETIINQIQEIRSKNNKNWMDILRIATKYSPEKTKEILSAITDCDKRISQLTQRLAKG